MRPLSTLKYDVSARSSLKHAAVIGGPQRLAIAVVRAVTAALEAGVLVHVRLNCDVAVFDVDLDRARKVFDDTVATIRAEKLGLT